MKIQVRTLNQNKYEIEVDPSKTIEQLKDIIEEKYQHTKAHQVLIFSGRVLANELTIESCNVKENDFLVLMVKKTAKGPSPAAPASNAKPQATETTTTPTTSTSTSTSTPVSTPSTTPAPAPVTSIPTESKAEKEAEKAATTGADLYSQSASTLITGSELQSVADKIAAMGFPKDQVLLALRASFGNPDRALEYLLNGIPEGVVQPMAQQPPARLGGSGSGSSGASAATGSTTGGTTGTTGGSTGGSTGGGTTGGTTGGGTSGIRLPANILPPGSGLSTGGIQLPANILPPFLLGQNTPPTTGGTGVGASAAPGGGGGGGVFDFLRNHPAFPTLRQIARTDPARLQEIMTRLVQQTPQLLPLIAQHQDEFIGLLREGGPTAPPGGIQIQVTPQDQEAIDHLVGLGFSRNKAMEAYFLFEKDEQMAANYLLTYGHEEDEMEFIDEGGDDDDE